MPVPPFSTFYAKEYTFSDDEPHRIEDNADVILSSCNVHVYDNDVKYGNSAIVPGIVRTNAVIWFDAPVRPFDMVFQNNVAGSNGRIVIIGPLYKR